MPRVVSLGEYATRSTDLNDVGAVLYGLADLVLDGLDAIGHTEGLVVVLRSEKVFVAVPPRDTERGARGTHARAGNIAGLDGIAQGNIGEQRRANVPH